MAAFRPQKGPGTSHFGSDSPTRMDVIDTAAQALQQALSDELNGDAEAPQQGGHTTETVKLTPEPPAPKEAAKTTNDEAKRKRISDKEWQDMQERAKKAETAETKLKKLKEALEDAPPEVKKEEDLASQVQALKELNDRKEWEMDHPKVRTEKYSDAWKKACSEYRDLIQAGRMTYDKLWNMVRNESSTIKEELATQEQEPPTPTFSPGTVARAGNANALAAQYLREAGMMDAAKQLE